MRYAILQTEKDESQPVNSILYLQNHHQTKIQQILYNNCNYYSSQGHHHQFISILIFSFLTKIFNNYSQLNQHRFNQFKSIIYSSNLTNLANKYAVKQSQLIKYFTKCMNTLTIGQQSDESIRKLMNYPVIQELIIYGISWINSSKEGEDQMKQVYVDWFQSHFNIKVQVTNKPIIQQSQQTIFIDLIDGRYARQAYHQDPPKLADSHSVIDLFVSKKQIKNTEFGIESIVITNEQASKHSLQKVESGEQKCEKGMINSDWKRYKVERKQKLSLLDIFCCRMDD